MPKVCAHAGADRQRSAAFRRQTGSSRSNGTASAPSVTSITASCAWSRATAIRSTASIPSSRFCRITSRRRRRFSTARSPRSTRAACPASSCSSAASTSPKRAPSPRSPASIPVVFFAFDLLYLDGHDLRGVPLIERKRLLEGSPQARRPGSLFGSLRGQRPGSARSRQAAGPRRHRRQARQQFLRIAPHLGLGEMEGDRRRRIFVLCGFTKGERDHFGALVLGDLRSRKADLGRQRRHRLRSQDDGADSFEARAARDQRNARLQPDKNLPRDVTWTRPELVCEVKFSNWTEDGRLRAPVFLGLRPDIDPSECVRERTPEWRATAKRSRVCSIPPIRKKRRLTIDGHRLKFTNLDKVFYPKDGYRKRDLLNYYDAVAPLLLPHLKDRPLSLKRYPNGIDKPFLLPEGSRPRAFRSGCAPRRRRRDSLRDRRRSRDAAVSGESRLHRSQSVDEPRRFATNIPTTC